MVSEDKLTGLGTCDALLARVAHLAREADPEGETSLGLMDLDFFKALNDSLGHAAGDEIIKLAADHVRKGVGRAGTVYRYGGEEYAVLLPGWEKERAFLLLEKIRNEFDKEHVIRVGKKRHKVKVTFSTGIATLPDDGVDWKTVLSRADDALFRAKVSGRNKVSLAREEKMVTKTSHYSQGQLRRLGALGKKEGVGEALLLREALDDLLRKYNQRGPAE